MPPGTLIMLILRVLQDGPLHGFISFPGKCFRRKKARATLPCNGC